MLEASTRQLCQVFLDKSMNTQGALYLSCAHGIGHAVAAIESTPPETSLTLEEGIAGIASCRDGLRNLGDLTYVCAAGPIMEVARTVRDASVDYCDDAWRAAPCYRMLSWLQRAGGDTPGAVADPRLADPPCKWGQPDARTKYPNGGALARRGCVFGYSFDNFVKFDSEVVSAQQRLSGHSAPAGPQSSKGWMTADPLWLQGGRAAAAPGEAPARPPTVDLFCRPFLPRAPDDDPRSGYGGPTVAWYEALSTDAEKQDWLERRGDWLSCVHAAMSGAAHLIAEANVGGELLEAFCEAQRFNDPGATRRCVKSGMCRAILPNVEGVDMAANSQCWDSSLVEGVLDRPDLPTDSWVDWPRPHGEPLYPAFDPDVTYVDVVVTEGTATFPAGGAGEEGPWHGHAAHAHEAAPLPMWVGFALGVAASLCVAAALRWRSSSGGAAAGRSPQGSLLGRVKKSVEKRRGKSDRARGEEGSSLLSDDVDDLEEEVNAV
jgi:hypothetical protein